MEYILSGSHITSYLSNGVLVSVLWPILETVLGSEIELARQYQGLPYVGWLMTGTV